MMSLDDHVHEFQYNQSKSPHVIVWVRKHMGKIRFLGENLSCPYLVCKKKGFCYFLHFEKALDLEGPPKFSDDNF